LSSFFKTTGCFFEWCTETFVNISLREWLSGWLGKWSLGHFLISEWLREWINGKKVNLKIVTNKRSDMDTKKESKQEPIPRWERKCLYDRKSLLRQTMFWNRFVLLFVNGYWILFDSKIFSCFCFFNCYLFKLYKKIDIHKVRLG